MGILSVVHRNLLTKSKKSQLLKYLSSSNLWFIRRISSPAGSNTDDLKSNNNKLMLLIQHFDNKSGTRKCSSPFIPYDYSTISAENSWTDHHNRCKPFSSYCANFVIAGSCNELMLILFYNLDSPFTGYGKYLLWNPTTDNFTILPPPGPAFTNMHGFGFDSESQDYKVIRFPRYKKSDDNHFKLYSLKTNSWKKITYPSCCGYPYQRPCVHVNGVCYWLTRISDSVFIFSFNFANEKFSSAPHIPRPPKFDEHRKGILNDFVLVEFDGLLGALVHSGLGHEFFSFEVWGWNGESWLERMLRTTIVVRGGVFNVVGLFRNDKLFLQSWREDELLLFDCTESKLENLGIRADSAMVNIFPFMPGTPFRSWKINSRAIEIIYL